MPATPASHRVVAGDDGPVLVKRATGTAAAARLTGEATVLRTLAHPATVRVVAHRTGPERAELHLAWVGPHSLATVTGLPVASAGALVAEVATTVADLHRAGVVHGRLTADHVLLGPDGRAVLTGFASATAATPAGRTADVAALGVLLASLVAPHDGGPVVPEHRRPHRGDGGTRAALLTLADRAQADDPPDAADLATSIRSIVTPSPRQPVIRFPARKGDLITGSGRRTLAGVALAACVAATVAAAAWLSPSGAGPEEAVPTTSTVPTTTGPDPTTTTAPPPPSTSTTAPCPAVAGMAADVDGDGCTEAVVVMGEKVTVGGTTWRAGRAGDVAVVGDWDCDGRATIASLRVATGEVFVFDRWERALTVDATTQVEGATALRTTDHDGCATLVVDRADGGPIEVEAA